MIRKLANLGTSSTRPKAEAKPKAKGKKVMKGGSARRWSQRVTRGSDALDLEAGVFTRPTARQVALSLKHSADRSTRRKSDPYRSAMSMLTFHMNRAGRQLSAERRRVLDAAKEQLRRLYGKEA